MQKTKPTKQNNITRSWHLYDVSGKILGRACSEIAILLRGKAKPYYVSHLDCGDYVVVINSSKVIVTGNKEKKKIYSSYSGYPGGLKNVVYKDIFNKHPERVIKMSIEGMLPDNKLKAKFIKRLYIYPNAQHPYSNRFK